MSQETRSRLERDTEEAMLGGVCAGIANYLGTDPLLIRIAFLIWVMGDYGFIYLLLWILMPEKDYDR